MILCLSVLGSACYRLFAFLSAYDCLYVLLSACYQAEFDISEPKKERNLGGFTYAWSSTDNAVRVHLQNIRDLT
jgi:hypothetical protein